MPKRETLSPSLTRLLLSLNVGLLSSCAAPAVLLAPNSLSGLQLSTSRCRDTGHNHNMLLREENQAEVLDFVLFCFTSELLIHFIQPFFFKKKTIVVFDYYLLLHSDDDCL